MRSTFKTNIAQLEDLVIYAVSHINIYSNNFMCYVLIAEDLLRLVVALQNGFKIAEYVTVTRLEGICQINSCKNTHINVCRQRNDG